MRLSLLTLSTLAATLCIQPILAVKTSTGNGFNPALFGALPECGVSLPSYRRLHLKKS